MKCLEQSDQAAVYLWFYQTWSGGTVLNQSFFDPQFGVILLEIIDTLNNSKQQNL